MNEEAKETQPAETAPSKPGFDREGKALFRMRPCKDCQKRFQPTAMGNVLCPDCKSVHLEARRAAKNEGLRNKNLPLTWLDNLETLPAIEKQILQQKANAVAEYTTLLNERPADPKHFRKIKKFITDSSGTTREWLPAGQEKEFPEAVEHMDESYRKYGLSLRIWQLHWETYLKTILMQAGVVGLKPKEIVLVEPRLQAEIEAEFNIFEKQREALDAKWPKNIWNPVTKLYEPEDGNKPDFHGKTDEQIEAEELAAKLVQEAETATAIEEQAATITDLPPDAPFIRPKPAPATTFTIGGKL